jgi:hypothetical protein
MVELDQLKRRNSQLETRIDFLETQFQRLDEMLMKFGFDHGIRTLAETLNEAVEIERILRADQ